MRTIIFTVLLAFCSTTIYASMVTIDATIKTERGNPPTVVELYCYDRPDWSQSNLITDGKFSFTTEVKTTGVYSLRINNTDLDLILSPQEPLVKFTATAIMGRVRDANTGESEENKAYQAFLSTTSPYDKQLYAHYMHCGNSDSCEQVLHNLLLEYRTAIEKIQNNYPSSYTASLLCRMKKPYIAKDIKQTSSDFRQHFFNTVPFRDTAILGVPAYKEMISMYTDFLIEPSAAAQQAWMNRLLDSASHHPRIFSQTSYTLFEQLLRWGREKMLAMYIAWYPTHQKAINNGVLDMKVSNTAKVMPGQKFQEITLPDTTGSPTTLGDIVKQSKTTLLLFWSSECSHCRAEMPMIKNLYTRYHDKGFNIYAVSIDADGRKWKDFIASEHLPWTHVLCGEHSKPNPVMEYEVLFTPTLVLIGPDGNIQHRFDHKSTLESHIIEVLGR